MSPVMKRSTRTYEIKTLTDEQKSLVKASIPILESAGETLTSQFYQYMLKTYPEVRMFFNPSNQVTLKQPRILAYALLNYAKNIDDITPLTAFVKQICVKHCGLQIHPEHYPIVGNSLIHTMKTLLGEETATKEFLEAWSTAYGNLAQTLINIEHEMYLEQSWEGFREFEVQKIVQECSDVKSIYFAAKNGKPLDALPGQYVTFKFYPDGKTGQPQLREYSISNTPSDGEFRISVRLVKDGKISGYIHHELKEGSTIEVAPPIGQLYNENSTRDLVVFAGGIGITPMISIMEAALDAGKKVDLHYSNQNIDRHPFGDWIKQLQAQNDKFSVHEHITTRLSEKDFDASLLEKEVYMIGPQSYMDFVEEHLRAIGVNDLNTETFGPLRT